VAEEYRDKAAREEELARRSQLGVARDPLGVVAAGIAVLVPSKSPQIVRQYRTRSFSRKRGGRLLLMPNCK
jgi:hypothetical protein